MSEKRRYYAPIGAPVDSMPAYAVLCRSGVQPPTGSSWGDNPRSTQTDS